jgi:exonuclease III
MSLFWSVINIISDQRYDLFLIKKLFKTIDSEERRSFKELYTEHGYIDTFRLFYPDLKDQYTYWGNRSKENLREKNKGRVNKCI